MKNTKLWLIKAITNLHVGSGDADYGIVDKHVQRDPITGLPVINSSSIKGAFREALGDALQHDAIKIFGTENRGGKNTDLKQGSYRFFSAKLLALPIRSSESFYYIATCPELLNDFVSDAKHFGYLLPDGLEDSIKKLSKIGVKKSQPIHFGGNTDTIMLEDWESKRQSEDSGIEALLGITRIAVLHASDFQQLSDELPIIARNHLENGISANLWYEQVVPREARFYTQIAESDNTLTEIFKRESDNLLQVGGNATVGYGLCKFTKL